MEELWHVDGNNKFLMTQIHSISSWVRKKRIILDGKETCLLIESHRSMHYNKNHVGCQGHLVVFELLLETSPKLVYYCTFNDDDM
jgi:hypothetical protein